MEFVGGSAEVSAVGIFVEFVGGVVVQFVELGLDEFVVHEFVVVVDCVSAAFVAFACVAVVVGEAFGFGGSFQ